MKKWLWLFEVGREVGVSPRTVCRLADAGVLTAVRDAKGRRRFAPEAVDCLKKHFGLADEPPIDYVQESAQ